MTNKDRHHGAQDIYLEKISQRHLNDLYSCVMASKLKLKRYLPWVHAVHTSDDFQKLIRYYEVKYAKEGALTTSIMVNKQAIGIIGMNFLDRKNSHTALGYWIHTPYEGRGLVTESCRIFIQYCFLELDLKKVSISCAEHNLKSRNIPLRLGFRYEDCVKDGETIGDKSYNLLHYGLSKKTWRQSLDSSSEVCLEKFRDHTHPAY